MTQMLLVAPAELAHMLAIESRAATGRSAAPDQARSVDVLLPGVVQAQQIAVHVMVLDLLEQRLHQRRLAGSPHVTDEFPVELVDPEPARRIEPDAFGKAGHAELGLGERLLKRGGEADRLVEVAIVAVPVALPALADPDLHLGRRDGPCRDLVRQRADQGAVDLLEMVGLEQLAEVALARSASMPSCLGNLAESFLKASLALRLFFQRRKNTSASAARIRLRSPSAHR